MYACKLCIRVILVFVASLSLVDPNVTMSASKTVVKLGSSVNITCTADGYPPAKHLSYFKLHDPTNRLINDTKLTLNGTTVTYHISNVSRLDEGEYDCIVTQKLNETLQGSSKLNLTVYGKLGFIFLRHKYSIIDYKTVCFI